MGFTRSAILNKEEEEVLRSQLRKLWTQGKTASEIAEILEFGKPKTSTGEDNPYYKLKKFHVWNYKTKFNNDKDHPARIPKHSKCGIKKGQRRYKEVPDETMSFDEFKERLNSEVPSVPLDNTWYSRYVHRKRAYLILHWWTPLRKSEIYERKAKDFTVRNNFVEINLKRKKKYYRKDSQTEPFFLELNLPMVEEVVNWISLFEDNEKPFDFSGVTAWQYVKDVFPNKFPHFWRFNYITTAVDTTNDVGELIRILLQDTGLDIQTIMKYIMKNIKFRGSINKIRAEIANSTKESPFLS